jgi:hypothetical protein
MELHTGAQHPAGVVRSPLIGGVEEQYVRR